MKQREKSKILCLFRTSAHIGKHLQDIHEDRNPRPKSNAVFCVRKQTGGQETDAADKQMQAQQPNVQP